MKTRISTWSAEHIATACRGSLTGTFVVDLVSTDSRSDTPGALFVALVGDRFDGHDFVASAIENGAAAVLVSKPSQANIPTVLVDDTLRALQELAKGLWDDATGQGMASIALTGSNGKTTTKELIAAIARARHSKVHATQGNLNNHIGMPLTVCALPHDAQVAVVEMGANRFGDIQELVSIAPADVRVVTSIGAAHLEALGDLDGVRRVKSEVFLNVARPIRAVVPVEETGRLTIPATARVITFGAGADFDFRVESSTLGGQRVTVGTPQGDLSLRLPLVGLHNASNLACALAAVWALNEQLPRQAEIQTELDRLIMPGGRFRHIKSGEWSFVDDAYNANPSSVLASFTAFVGAAPQLPVYAVIGEMLELGEHAEAMHVETAQSLAQLGGVEEFLFVGRFADVMAKAAIGQGARAIALAESVDAAAHLRSLPPGTVFIKASRGARLERVIEMINSRPWS